MTSKTDPAAINFIQAMRRRAIARLEARDPTHRFEPACVLEVTGQGNLTCHAEFGPVTVDEVPTYRTRFELNGAPISLIDAERVAMGLAPGVAA